jgi:hypothetical protein
VDKSAPFFLWPGFDSVKPTYWCIVPHILEAGSHDLDLHGLSQSLFPNTGVVQGSCRFLFHLGGLGPKIICPYKDFLGFP